MGHGRVEADERRRRVDAEVDLPPRRREERPADADLEYVLAVAELPRPDDQAAVLAPRDDPPAVEPPLGPRVALAARPEGELCERSRANNGPVVDPIDPEVRPHGGHGECRQDRRAEERAAKDAGEPPGKRLPGAARAARWPRRWRRARGRRLVGRLGRLQPGEPSGESASSSTSMASARPAARISATSDRSSPSAQRRISVRRSVSIARRSVAPIGRGRRRLLAQAGEAGPEPVPPVRELRRALLASQHRRRAGGPEPEVGRSDPVHPAVQPRLLENRFREVGPRAVTPRRQVVDARTADRAVPASPPPGGPRRSGSRAGRRPPKPRRARRRAGASFARNCGPPSRRATTSGRSSRPEPVAPPRASSARTRQADRRVALDVRLVLAAVEDVVGREVDDGCPQLDHVSGSSTFTLRAPSRSASASSTFVHAAACRTSSGRSSRGTARPRPTPCASGPALGKGFRQRRAELPAGAGDELHGLLAPFVRTKSLTA